MTEIILNNKIIEKYCNFFKVNDNSFIQIFPKDNNFLKYWKYRKHLLVSNVKSSNNIIISNEEEFKTRFVKSLNSFLIENVHFLVFEFPDDYPEEELFYFKMKYGG